MTAWLKERLKRLRNTQPFNWIATTSIRFVLRITGRKSESIIKHLHRVGIVRAKLPNGRILRLWSRADDWISTQIFWSGWNAYETETLALFFRLASAGETILDIGAHVGLFALVAGHANPKARVFAFEPVTDSFERLQRNVRLNELSNVQCVNSAVGDTDGTGEVFHQPGLTFTASLSRTFMDWQETWSSSPITVVTGDKFISDNQIAKLDLIKIDTESTEPQVLRGLRETLKRDRPHIICEVLPSFTGAELTAALAPLGYYYYHITDRGLVWRETITGDNEFRNYLFSAVSPDSINKIVDG
jgi:FkbM family methyltransferase